jgi:hypothetical protein
MESRQNVWDTWYLMTLDKPCKVQSKFCNIIISYHNDKMFFQLNYRHDGSGQIGVGICSKAHAQVKALFGSCGGIVL